jgi:hypothetical protein
MKTTITPRKRGLILTLLVTGLTLCLSCTKDDVTPDVGGAFPTPAYPQPNDADAILVAVKASAPSPVQMPSIPGVPISPNEVVLELGLGIAKFKNNTKADLVKLNGTDLPFSNGTHVWMPNFKNVTDPTSLTGINLNGNVQWEVSNPNIQKTLSGFPSKPNITSDKTITKASGYQLTHNRVSNAQKILYAIYAGNDKYILKEAEGNATGMNFTTEELSILSGTKNGMIQINAYTINDENIGGKKVYFVRQNSYTLTGVTIQ